MQWKGITFSMLGPSWGRAWPACPLNPPMNILSTTENLEIGNWVKTRQNCLVLSPVVFTPPTRTRTSYNILLIPLTIPIACRSLKQSVFCRWSMLLFSFFRVTKLQQLLSKSCYSHIFLWTWLSNSRLFPCVLSSIPNYAMSRLFWNLVSYLQKIQQCSANELPVTG